MYRIVPGWRASVMCLAVVVAMLAPASRADEVTDQIDEAVSAYKAKDLSTAAVALEAAMALIRQQKAETWKTLLPDPLPGWSADDAETASVGSAMLGGGTSVARKYRRDDDTVDVSYITDSPIMQGLGAIFAGGMISGSDNKLVVIDGRKMTYMKGDNSYQAMVAGKVLVKIEGSHGVDDQTLRAYLKAIKFADVEKASQ